MKNSQLYSVNDIRETFINYFVEKGHTKIPSSTLVPLTDSSLLFTNSGMVQFKEIFMGNKNPASPRAVSAQRCLRAGGKHNDLENVGFTARHHTFFEMLGNFSFGDYFKEDAISFAWELLTKVFLIDEQRLIVTVYDQDDDAYRLWKTKIGLSDNQIIKIGDNKGSRYASDNFWQMADVGPCGPCSEIFFDHGSHINGGLPGSKNENGDRFVEIWNLVFMQYQRLESGELVKLPNLSVDTGMGLERISAVMQKVNSNFEIDLFRKLTDRVMIRTETKVKSYSHIHPSVRVIADHIRACSFLVLDGVLPSNEGNGYVLRRIIRRALRHGHKLGKKEPFFSLLVQDLSNIMGDHFSELQEKVQLISSCLFEEEQKFNETLSRGIEILENVLKKSRSKKIDGKTIFLLYDTYGFPTDLTADICREKEFTLDLKGFELEMRTQKELARTTNKFKYPQSFDCDDPSTNFVGYDTNFTCGKIISIFQKEKSVTKAIKGDSVMFTLSESCFYAESGGQVGDIGYIESDSAIAKVTDTTKNINDVFLHHAVIEQGEIKVDQIVQARVDLENRNNIKRNHSATHLLHYALREVLGEHVKQKGSLVNGDRTRFDFSHPNVLSNEQIKSVEKIVNYEILDNSPTSVNIMDYLKAIDSGAIGLFGEKYDSNVRVLTIGTSKELCGGTHVERTGDIGFFKIMNETGVSSGVRRIEACTGYKALSFIQETYDTVDKVSKIVNTSSSKLYEKITVLLEKNKKLENYAESVQTKWLFSVQKKLIKDPEIYENINLVSRNIDSVDSKALRSLIDYVKSSIPPVVVVLTTINNDRVNMIVGVSKDISKNYNASKIVSKLALKIGGKGGGRDDLAQAGGNKVNAINEVHQSLKGVLNEFNVEKKSQ
ncbi:MAG: alanine--tRNA ligase [Betaproteobacteria bacterium TMED156]|nr:MAG: alanine--tRNA ligase [Betaproteobacteria bacterium TMED156]